MWRWLWVVLLAVLCVVGCQRRVAPDAGVALDDVLGGAPDGFLRADAPRAFDFPRDHLAHTDFRNEWWYFTGNLATADGRAFGYQLTFFRAGLSAEPAESESTWSANAFWMAHFAITDISAGRHHHASRFARDGALAGQAVEPFRVWLDDWTLSGQSQAGDAHFPWRLEARAEGVEIALELAPTKPIVLNGENGLSHKGGAPGNASYYYSATRLASSGQLTLADQVHRVSGQSWLDREWSTSALAAGTVGWDWFSLQLDSGHDVMLYQLRQDDGTAHPASAGTLVAPDGRAVHLRQADFNLEAVRHWTAPDGRRYPVRWRVSVPQLALDAVVEARVDAQWMNTAVVYWEGAVAVRDVSGQALGLGYLEMTGY